MVILNPSLHHHLFDFRDGLCGVQTLRAGIRAIHDRVATIKSERIFEMIETITGRFIARVNQPTIGLQQCRGSEIAVAIPPIARARRRTARAENTFVKTIELFAIFARLLPFFFGRGR